MSKKQIEELELVQLQLHLLNREEKSDPWTALDELFEKCSLEEYQDELWNWFAASCSDEIIWNRRYPGDLAYSFELLNKFLELSWLIHNKNALSGKFSLVPDALQQPSVNTNTRHGPRCRLQPFERRNPYLVLNEFFDLFTLHDSQARLLDWLVIALSNSSLQEHDIKVELHFYEMTVKLINALHEISVRNLAV